VPRRDPVGSSGTTRQTHMHVLREGLAVAAGCALSPASRTPSPSRPSSPTFAALGPPSRPALPHPPRPQSGRLPARSGPRSLTLAPLHPLHPRLDREPAAAPDHWGPAGALDAEPSPSPPRTRRCRPAAGAHGGSRTAPTPAAPAEVALVVPARFGPSWAGRSEHRGHPDRAIVVTDIGIVTTGMDPRGHPAGRASSSRRMAGA